MKALVHAQKMGLQRPRKVECRFYKLELVYKKYHVVAHLRIHNNNGKMQGMALYQC